MPHCFVLVVSEVYLTHCSFILNSCSEFYLIAFYYPPCLSPLMKTQTKKIPLIPSPYISLTGGGFLDGWKLKKLRANFCHSHSSCPRVGPGSRFLPWPVQLVMNSLLLGLLLSLKPQLPCLVEISPSLSSTSCFFYLASLASRLCVILLTVLTFTPREGFVLKGPLMRNLSSNLQYVLRPVNLLLD